MYNKHSRLIRRDKLKDTTGKLHLDIRDIFPKHPNRNKLVKTF